MSKTENFYQKFLGKKSATQGYVEIELEIEGEKMPTVFLRKPNVRATQKSGVLTGNLENIGVFIVDYIIENLFEKEEDGEVGKNIFTVANRDMLLSEWGEIQMKALNIFTESLSDKLGNDTKNI